MVVEVSAKLRRMQTVSEALTWLKDAPISSCVVYIKRNSCSEESLIATYTSKLAIILETVPISSLYFSYPNCCVDSIGCVSG